MRKRERIVTDYCNVYRNGSHMSDSDTMSHGTVKAKTTVQTSTGEHQVAHIYFDANYTYTGHTLYATVKKD
jgi:hypothetical protein